MAIFVESIRLRFLAAFSMGLAVVLIGLDLGTYLVRSERRPELFGESSKFTKSRLIVLAFRVIA